MASKITANTGHYGYFIWLRHDGHEPLHAQQPYSRYGRLIRLGRLFGISHALA